MHFNFIRDISSKMIVSVEHSKLLKARSLSNILSLITGENYDGEGRVTVTGNSPY